MQKTMTNDEELWLAADAGPHVGTAEAVTLTQETAEAVTLTQERAEAVTLTQETAEAVTLTELQAENERLNASLRLERAQRQITAELAREGARSPGLLFESVKGDLQFGDDGAALNAAALVARLKSEFPEQFAADRPAVASIDAGAGSGAAASPLSREALKKMKPAEIAALNWDEVKRVLARSV